MNTEVFYRKSGRAQSKIARPKWGQVEGTKVKKNSNKPNAFFATQRIGQSQKVGEREERGAEEGA